MSYEKFISESQKHLDERESELKKYLDVLNKLNGGRLNIYETMTSAIYDKLKSLILNWASKNQTIDRCKNKAEEAAVNSMSGISSSDKYSSQNREVLSMLGSILATDTEAPASFIKISADNLLINIEKRREMLEALITKIDDLNEQFNLINNEWYSDYKTDVENSIVEVEDALVGIMSVRAYAQNGVAAKAEIQDIKIKLNKAIEYMSKPDAQASLLDLNSIIKGIDDDIGLLLKLDKDTEYGLNGVKESKSSFIGGYNDIGGILQAYTESMEANYNIVDSTLKSMKATHDDGTNSDMVAFSGEWMISLASVLANIDVSTDTYITSISDPSNPNTILLDNMISNLGFPDRQLDFDISEDLEELNSLAAKRTLSNVPVPEFSGAYSRTRSKIITNIANLITIAIDIESYVPEEVSTVIEYMKFINSIDRDRLKTLILNSKWGEIFRVTESTLSYSDTLAGLISGFINLVTDSEMKNELLDFYYTIQSNRRMRSIAGLTFSDIKKKATDDIKNIRLKEVEDLQVEIDTFKEQGSLKGLGNRVTNGS